MDENIYTTEHLIAKGGLRIKRKARECVSRVKGKWWKVSEGYSGGQNYFNVYYFGTEGLIQNRIKYEKS